MARKREGTLAEQVQRIAEHRLYLRSGISALLTFRDNREAMSEGVAKQLQEMLDYTDD